MTTHFSSSEVRQVHRTELPTTEPGGRRLSVVGPGLWVMGLRLQWAAARHANARVRRASGGRSPRHNSRVAALFPLPAPPRACSARGAGHHANAGGPGPSGGCSACRNSTGAERHFGPVAALPSSGWLHRERCQGPDSANSVPRQGGRLRRRQRSMQSGFASISTAAFPASRGSSVCICVRCRKGTGRFCRYS
jgi:hypothetical protein